MNTIAGGGATTSFANIIPGLSASLRSLRGLSGDRNGKIYCSTNFVGEVLVRGMFVTTQSPSASPTVSILPTISPSCNPTSIPPTIFPSIVPTTSPSYAPTVPVYHMYTLAGNGISASADDNVIASAASFKVPTGLFMQIASNNLYFAETDARRVRKVSLTSGIATVFAGTGVSNSVGDGGQATSAQFVSTFGIYGLSTGAIYISDANSNKIRLVATDGIIAAFAGSSSTAATLPNDFNGDGGQASSAVLRGPRFLALDAANNLYLADLQNNKVRKITHIGNIISTVVGTGGAASDGDGGQATAATIKNPYGVFVDSANKLYLTEFNGYKIRKVTNGLISLLAGNDGGVALDNIPVSVLMNWT